MSKMDDVWGEIIRNLEWYADVEKQSLDEKKKREEEEEQQKKKKKEEEKKC